MKQVLVVATTRPEDKLFNDDLTRVLDELGFESIVVPYLHVLDNIEQVEAASCVIVSGVPFHYPAESAEELRHSSTPGSQRTAHNGDR